MNTQEAAIIVAEFDGWVQTSTGWADNKGGNFEVSLPEMVKNYLSLDALVSVWRKIRKERPAFNGMAFFENNEFAFADFNQYEPDWYFVTQATNEQEAALIATGKAIEEMK